MVTDSRINELLTMATDKLGIDIATCHESSMSKIYTWLKIAKLKRVGITDEELEAVRNELEPWL